MKEDSFALANELMDCLGSFKRLNKSARVMDTNTITPAEFHLLMLIHRKQTEEGITASQLSKIMYVSPPTVTGAINALERRNYIERIRGSADRRIVNVRTTKDGEKVLSNVRDEMRNTLTDVTEYLGTEDTKEMIRILNRMNEYIINRRRND